jgi:diguanylate cyclase (GGDEF)-like protein/PAS domain S-box-containing protein
MQTASMLVRLLLAIVLVLPLCASAAPLRVAMDQNYPPFVFRNADGKLEGYTVDLWRLWERKTGVKVELYAVDWPRVQPLLDDRKVDVVDTIFRTEARARHLDFSAPYAAAGTSIYADRSIVGIRDLASLKGFQVAVQAGDACVDRLRALAGVSVRVLPSYASLLDALADRDVKLFCKDDYAANYDLYRLDLNDTYVKAFELGRDELHRAVRKGDAATLALVERGMARITSAEKDALRDKWMARPLGFARYARPLVEVMAVLGGLVLLLAAWLLSMRRAVRARTRELEHEVVERRQRERTILEQERLLQEMSALARIGAWELNLVTGAFQWTDEVARIYGTATGEPLTLDACLASCNDEGRLRARSARAAAEERGEPFDIEFDIDSAGQRKWVRVLCSPVPGRPATLRGTVQDVTRRRELEESMRMATLIYQTSLEAIVVTDDENRIVDANPAFTAQTGQELAAVLGTRPGLFDSRLHDGGFYARIGEQLDHSGYWQGEVLDRDGEGAFTAKFVDIRVIRRPDGRIFRHVIQFHDISAQKQKDELLWRQTNFDPLTGLPNRRLFLDRLEQDIRKAHGAGSGLGVLLLDLDRFKDVNDSFGPANGDRALVELTRRMAACVPEDATMGRLGGDTFALVTDESDRRPHMEAVAQAVLEAVAAPLPLGPVDVAYVTASAGISVYPDDGADATELVRNAEHAVRLSKGAGRGQFQYFTPALQRQAHAKLMLTNALREALARQELQVYYQPIVEVATGSIHKAETLLRWHHPERGMVSPAHFIPLAEEAGMIVEISDWVLGEAIASVQHWHRKYGRVIELSVNFSPTHFAQRGPLSWLDRVVQANLPRHSLTVEITEGVLVSDPEQVGLCFGRLHAAGARVSIDDFGTGFSALSYLKHFDVDYLKIDKSFIDHLPDDRSDRALTEAIVDLAHRLGIQAIAEGVENGAQRDALAAIGCDYIQGFYYSEAVTRELFERLLERGEAPGVV